MSLFRLRGVASALFTAADERPLAGPVAVAPCRLVAAASDDLPALASQTLDPAFHAIARLQIPRRCNVASHIADPSSASAGPRC